MIYQSGYLTIKDWNPTYQMFLLDYPNQEVKNSFISELAESYLGRKQSWNTWIGNLRRMLDEGRAEEVGESLKGFLAGVPYALREQSKEKHFQYTFYLILRMLDARMVQAEKMQSQGRVDCVVERDKFIYLFEFKLDGSAEFIYLFEFKLDGSAEEALKQIEEKGYAKEYTGDKRKLFRIGANFSSKTGTIEEWKIV